MAGSEVAPENIEAQGLSSWVFIDETPTAAQMMGLLESLPAVHGIETAKYYEFVLPLTNNQKFGKDDRGADVYKPVTRMYMTVAGRVRMLNDAAERWAWEVIESWKIVHDNPFTLRIGIEIHTRLDEPGVATAGAGVISGRRFGVSKAKGGDSAWEKMETAARGRAIAAFGFGVLPGSGIASHDEMQDAMFGEREPRQTQDDRPKEDLVGDVRAKIERLRLLRNQDQLELDQALQAYVKDRLGQAVAITPSGLDLAKIKPGNLLLLEADLNQKIMKEERLQSEL